MCNSCVPTFDGYVYWDYDGTNAFIYKASPDIWNIQSMCFMVEGPLDLTIPYI